MMPAKMFCLLSFYLSCTGRYLFVTNVINAVHLKIKFGNYIPSAMCEIKVVLGEDRFLNYN